MRIDTIYMGGCFPHQKNIAPEFLFHQILKNKYFENTGDNIDLEIIRYEKLSNCMEKLKKSFTIGKTQLVIFHIRMEPFLRSVKLYYKYKNKNNKISYSLNLPYFHWLNSEKYDMLTTAQNSIQNSPKEESKFHKYLSDLNLILGSIIANNKYSMQLYLKLIREIIDFCNQQNISFLLIGPASRPHTRFENYLSKQLHSYCINNLIEFKYNYIPAQSKNNVEGKSLFFENGIHATKEHHEWIASLLQGKIIEIFKQK